MININTQVGQTDSVEHQHRKWQSLLLGDWCAGIGSDFFESHESESLHFENAVTRDFEQITPDGIAQSLA